MNNNTNNNHYNKAIDILRSIPISIHCWQGDDVMGFEGVTGSAAGFAVTGQYMGRARNPQELMEDIEKVLSHLPGDNLRLNLHASYAITNGEGVERNRLEPRHFAPWVKFAKDNGIKLDFNPTLFAHPKADATLSSYDEGIRAYWVEHCIACIKIAEYFADELGSYCGLNIWIPDGYKNEPVDRLTPRLLLKDSLDKIFEHRFDKSKVIVSLESKVFGIGIESYTVGSHEFYLSYAMAKGLYPLIDNGHFHPTENVADKLSAIAPFFDKIPLHITRPMRWDSDHVIALDDNTKEIAREVVRLGHERFLIGLDFFDASINRLLAWVLGVRNVQKALLAALLSDFDKLEGLQRAGDMGGLMAYMEDEKMMPIGDAWGQFCEACNKHSSNAAIHKDLMQYEQDTLSKRR